MGIAVLILACGIFVAVVIISTLGGRLRGAEEVNRQLLELLSNCSCSNRQLLHRPTQRSLGQRLRLLWPWQAQ